MTSAGTTIAKFQAAFGAALTVEQAGSQAVVVVGKDRLREVLLFLRMTAASSIR